MRDPDRISAAISAQHVVDGLLAIARAIEGLTRALDRLGTAERGDLKLVHNLEED
jgi:hypothetical protein